MSEGTCGANLERMNNMQDITRPEIVEIQIRSDGKVVWVNVDGVCALRACNIKEVIVIDERQKEKLAKGAE